MGDQVEERGGMVWVRWENQVVGVEAGGEPWIFGYGAP